MTTDPTRMAVEKRKPPLRRLWGRRSRIALIVVAAIVALLLVLDIVLRYYVDWLWYREVGLLTVFWTRITTSLIVGPAFAVLLFAILYGNVEVARRLAPKFRPIEGIDVYEFVAQSASRRVRQVGIAVSALIALIVGFSTAGSWLIFVRAFNATPFGSSDPIFHHDLSFYVFVVPALQYISTFVFWTLLVTLIVTFAVHLLLGGIRLEKRLVQDVSGEPERSGPPGTSRHRPAGRTRAQSPTSQLCLAPSSSPGLGYFLKAWSLLYSTSGVVFGAGATDVNMRLPLIRVLMGIAWLLGAALIYNAVRGRRPLWPPIAVGGWIVALIVFLGIVPAIYQSLLVNPNQLAKESPYIARNIAATRTAYNLNAIWETPYSLKGDLTPRPCRTTA